MTLSPQSLIIFDCDGVLVDSEIISVTVDQLVLADLGWSISLEEIIDRFVGRSHAYFLEVVEEHIGRKLPDDWEDAYQHLYREALARDLQLVEGIVDALDAIDLPMCVASNGSHSKMEFTLKHAGLWSGWRTGSIGGKNEGNCLRRWNYCRKQTRWRGSRSH